MKIVAIVAAFVVLASAKARTPSGPNMQIESLHASRVGGVVINDVIVEDIVSRYEFDNDDVADDIFENSFATVYKVRQARLIYEPFTVTIDVQSNVATDAMFKIFLGPEYDSNGFPLSMEDNLEIFVELDSFVYTLTPGQNTIQRTSQIDSLSLSLAEILQNEGLSFVVSATNLI